MRAYDKLLIPIYTAKIIILENEGVKWARLSRVHCTTERRHGTLSREVITLNYKH